ncbi:MAG: C39 family peptidase [Kofleriaceae bacterium]
MDERPTAASGSPIKVALSSVTQTTDYTCGPAAVLAVCRYYGAGPATEREIELDMRMSPTGSDPAQLIEVLERYGLQHREYRPMTDDALRAELDRGHPVIVMLQAWAAPPPASYLDHWSDGHWVVAIGYTGAGVVFEDPMLEHERGFLTYDQLDERWHDLEGEDDRKVVRYGLAVWGDRGMPATQPPVMRPIA